MRSTPVSQTFPHFPLWNGSPLSRSRFTSDRKQACLLAPYAVRCEMRSVMVLARHNRCGWHACFPFYRTEKITSSCVILGEVTAYVHVVRDPSSAHQALSLRHVTRTVCDNVIVCARHTLWNSTSFVACSFLLAFCSLSTQPAVSAKHVCGWFAWRTRRNVAYVRISSDTGR